MNDLSPQQIQVEIMHLIHMERSPYSDWYVGIAKNPHIRLFQEHKVEMRNSWWIIRKAKNSEDARNVEKLIINTYGTDGDSGGGDEESVYVYAYKKSATTKP